MLFVWMGVALNPTSMPLLVSWPALANRDEKPVVGATLACRIRSSTTLRKSVKSVARRPLNSVASKPPSSSVVVSGLMSAAPTVSETRAPGCPLYVLYGSVVYFTPKRGWLPARPHARRNFRSLAKLGRVVRRYDAAAFG